MIRKDEIFFPTIENIAVFEAAVEALFKAEILKAKADTVEFVFNYFLGEYIEEGAVDFDALSFDDAANYAATIKPLLVIVQEVLNNGISRSIILNDKVQDSVLSIYKSLMSTSVVRILAPQTIRAFVNMFTANAGEGLLNLIDAIELDNLEDALIAADLVQFADILDAFFDTNAFADLVYGEAIRINDVENIAAVIDEFFELNTIDHVFSPVVANLVELYLNVDLSILLFTQ